MPAKPSRLMSSLMPSTADRLSPHHHHLIIPICIRSSLNIYYTGFDGGGNQSAQRQEIERDEKTKNKRSDPSAAVQQHELSQRLDQTSQNTPASIPAPQHQTIQQHRPSHRSEDLSSVLCICLLTPQGQPDGIGEGQVQKYQLRPLLSQRL